MFSPAGLERIIARAGWTVLARYHAGDVVASDPSSADHDERMFMLCTSYPPDADMITSPDGQAQVAVSPGSRGRWLRFLKNR
jgi:hypothetical protein